jgi:hypothetical protein
MQAYCSAGSSSTRDAALDEADALENECWKGRSGEDAEALGTAKTEDGAGVQRNSSNSPISTARTLEERTVAYYALYTDKGARRRGNRTYVTYRWCEREVLGQRYPKCDQVRGQRSSTERDTSSHRLQTHKKIRNKTGSSG